MRQGTWCGAATCWTTFIAATLAAALAPGAKPASGAEAGEPAAQPAGAITGVGSAKAERQPELLRVQFDLTGEGKDVKEAIAKLREREKVTRDKLSKLGATGKAVEVAEPRLVPSMVDQQAQLNRMIQMRSGRVGGAAPATGPAQQPVRVTASARAEWPLAAKTTEELLAAAHDLQTKVKAADLVPKGAAANLTPEEQEELEEQALMGEAAGQMQPQGPMFVYVSKVSPEERAKLTADAFAKAKEDAARLAKAAGVGLGQLRQLTSTDASDGADANNYAQMDPFGYARAMYGAAAFGGAAPRPPEDAGAAEATAVQPGKVTYRVTVSASFGIK